MRKSATILALSLAVVGALAFSVPSGGVPKNQAPVDNAAYAALFNQKLAALPKWKEEGEHEGFDQPDMFDAFDNLKRMDPHTGEVPADGLNNAYEYFLSEWGQPQVLAESNTNYGLFWDHRGPSGIGGRTRAILWDPANTATGKAFFAGGVGGGLWHTPDVSITSPVWTQVSPLYSNVAVTCINYDPSNPQVLYFGTGEGWNNSDGLRGAGVWKSTDGGSTWNQLASTTSFAFAFCQGIEVTSTGVLYVATKGGLHRSTDGGVTMTKVLGNGGLGSSSDWMTDIEQAGNGDLYVGASASGIYKSAASLGVNQGTVGNWTHLTTSFQAGYSRVELAASKSNSNFVYAVCEASNNTTPIYKSTNGGTSWAATSGDVNFGTDYSNGQAWYDLCIGVDPNDHLVVYTGGIDQHRTTNGGSSWTQITSGYGIPGLPYMHPDQHYIKVNPNNSQELVFSNDGGIYYSSNRGTGVSEHNNNYNVTQYYSCAIDPHAGANRIIGGAQDNGSSMVSAPGVGVGISLTGSDGAYVAIDAVKPDTMYTTTQYATVRRSRNGGSTFSSITNPALNESNTLFINPMEIDPVNPQNLYQASTALWRHASAGSGSAAGWQQISATTGAITAIAPAYNPSTTVYFAAGGTVYRIGNVAFANSTTVHPTVNPAGLGGGYINCIMVDPNDNNHIVVTFSSYGVSQRVSECRNADQGANAVWKRLTGNLPDIPCNWAAVEPNNPNGLLVGTDIGIFRCTDITLPASSIYWTPESMGMGLPRVEQIRVRYTDNMVFIGTHGRGFWSTNSYNLPPQASFAALNVNACNGYVQFSDSTANAPISWAWDFGDGNTATNQNPLHQYAANGTYTVTMTATNPNGSSSDTSTITVNVLTPPTAIAAADTSGCPGDTIQLGATGGGTYSWSPAGALINPTSANPLFVVTSSRTFIVTVVDSNGCSDTDTMIVTANSSPSVWAGADQTITTPGGSVNLAGSGAVTYVWSPSTGLSCTNCANPVASPTVTTTYTCTGYSGAGCFRSDNVTVFVNIVGVDPGQLAGFSIDAIAPQPMQDRGMIRFTLPEAQPVRLELLDLSGKLVGIAYEGNASAGQTQLAWERGNLASGVYFLQMVAGGNRAVKKIILQ